MPVRVNLPVDVLAAHLERFKEEHDAAPKPAKIDLATGIPRPHVAGRYLDAYAAMAAIDRAIANDERFVDLAPFENRATRVHGCGGSHQHDADRLKVRDTLRLPRRAGQPGTNVTRAASQIDGVVLMPDEIVSFNDNVGPRSVENGFASAPRMFKGEMREGMGGGTCQVAGTLHAAAFFRRARHRSERSNHSRPSGYIQHVGLDATVVYPVVNLTPSGTLTLPHRGPRIGMEKGTLAFELLGRERPRPFSCDRHVGVADSNENRRAAWPARRGSTPQTKGYRGLWIRKTRMIRLRDGRERMETTTDIYPPTLKSTWSRPVPTWPPRCRRSQRRRNGALSVRRQSANIERPVGPSSRGSLPLLSAKRPRTAVAFVRNWQRYPRTRLECTDHGAKDIAPADARRRHLGRLTLGRHRAKEARWPGELQSGSGRSRGHLRDGRG